MTAFLGSPQHQDSYRLLRQRDPLAVIYNQGQWRLYKVSALFKLQYSAIKLKQYRSKIKQTIVSVVAASSTIKYSVTVEADPNLKFSEDDADALVITVSTTQSESNAKPKVVHEAYLISWGMSNSVPDSVHLPYMLERGEKKVSTAVKSSLGNMFDCIIMPFSFSQRQLLQFGVSFVEAETKSNKQITFTYTTPRADHKNKVGLNFEIGDVYLIINSVKEEVTRQSDVVNLTYQILQNQIFHMFEVDVSALELIEINLPQAGIKNNGTVKMKTAEMVNNVFTILNEINSIDCV